MRNSDVTEIQLFKEYYLNTSKATLFAQLKKSFLIRTILISGPGSKWYYSQQ